MMPVTVPQPLLLQLGRGQIISKWRKLFYAHARGCLTNNNTENQEFPRLQNEEGRHYMEYPIGTAHSTAFCHTNGQSSKKYCFSTDLKALLMHQRRASLLVLLFCNPHPLESGEGCQDGTTDPYTVLSLWRGNHFDLNS